MLTNFYEKTIIVDTTCILAFAHIGRVQLLKEICPNLITTPEVVLEYQVELPSWIQVVGVKNAALTRSITALLGLGESSVIALALETHNPLVILDDKRARAYAKNIGIDYAGVIGLLRLGYKKGIIKDIDIIIGELKANHFHLPDNVEELIKR